ncbi:MAG TPA: hypothetical protein VJN18_17680 [Polyangiaceae bacterium]|nr:hypothetical protein [Polyangiaceae bacterium]
MDALRLDSHVVLVWLHPVSDPPPTEWDACMARIEQLKVELQGDLDRLRLLVVSDGGAPNAQQRTRLFSDLMEGRSRDAVVTCSLSNPIKRAIAATIGWLNPEFRAFDPDQAVQALEHIRCTAPAEQDAIWDALVGLQHQLPPNQTLQLMAGRLGRPNPIGRSATRSGWPHSNQPR